nr:RNA-directed DNA polymerase, eukaryota, reverse transcriptase zinc-binding domain protein [Tanacetum cinerariifolium]
NKSPGPDGYTFEFFRRYWRFIGSDLCSAVECFFESGSFPKESNSSFIALIPKVTDAKFVTDFRPISLIGCVYKVVTKILGNRLATEKKQAMIFKVDFAKAYDSVRWNYLLDVLQAFGFGPNWCKATRDGLFKGEWSESNMENIVKILKCFFLASGLKINIQNIQVLGVGVPRNIANQAASLIGCVVMQNPFRYLGVMVGDSMSRKLAWADTV